MDAWLVIWPQLNWQWRKRAHGDLCGFGVEADRIMEEWKLCYVHCAYKNVLLFQQGARNP
uniref:Uncharacterized protein n=1 Tax=Oryza punctata TaxID=4537 RepID=A0A0E0KJN9_ORYPU